MNATAQHLRETLAYTLPLLTSIDDATASIKPQPTKWSKKEILGHLIDSACNNQQKFIRMMMQSHLDFVGYAQDEWVALQRYNEQPWQEIISLWAAYNHHLAHLIEHVEASVLPHTISIDGSKPFTLEFIMQDYVEHLKHHLKQILPESRLQSSFTNAYNA